MKNTIITGHLGAGKTFKANQLVLFINETNVLKTTPTELFKDKNFTYLNGDYSHVIIEECSIEEIESLEMYFRKQPKIKVIYTLLGVWEDEYESSSNFNIIQCNYKPKEKKTASKIVKNSKTRIYVINENSSITVEANSIKMAEEQCHFHYPEINIKKIEVVGSPENIHELKSAPNEFRMVCEGLKRAEFRKNDRGFLLQDFLLLKEYDITNNHYSGREATLIISHKQTGFGIPEGYVVLSTQMIRNNIIDNDFLSDETQRKWDLNSSISTEYLMATHSNLNMIQAKGLLAFCLSKNIIRIECYGDGSIMYPQWISNND